jgi:hypothetical protein
MANEYLDAYATNRIMFGTTRACVGVCVCLSFTMFKDQIRSSNFLPELLLFWGSIT